MSARPPITVRPLGPDDAGALQGIRLEALMRHPEAYGSSFAHEAQMAPEAFARIFLPTPPGGMFGAFVGDQLAGITGLAVSSMPNQLHKGRIFAVYVQPLHRKSGIAARLLDAAIAHARAAGLLLITLSVTAGNTAAARLYASRSFRQTGLSPRATRVDNRFYDEEAMQLDLDQA